MFEDAEGKNFHFYAGRGGNSVSVTTGNRKEKDTQTAFKEIVYEEAETQFPEKDNEETQTNFKDLNISYDNYLNNPKLETFLRKVFLK